MEGSREGSRAGFDTRTALAWIGLIVLTLALIGLVWYGRTFLLLTFGGILLAVLLRAAIGFLVRRGGLPDRLAYTLVLVVTVALLVGFGFLIGPRLVAQAGEFSQQLPRIIEDARNWLQERPWGSWLVDQVDEVTGLAGGTEGQDSNAPGAGENASEGGADAVRPGGEGAQGEAGSAGGNAQGGPSQGDSDAAGGQDQSGQQGGGVLSTAFGLLMTVGTTLAHLAYVVVIGVFLAANPRLYRAGLIRLFPSQMQQRATEVLDELGTTLKYWLVGQLVLMVITGGLTGIGLAILGVPLALGLAFFVGLMEFVPFIGPIIGFIPILLMAAAQGVTTLLWALALYLVIQQVEGNVLVPLIQQRVVSLPPALTIAAVFLGGGLFGILGAILATPLVAVIFVLVKMLYVHDVLGQSVSVPGSEEAV